METVSREGLSEAEIERLADRLEASGDPAALTLEGVDGLFCALIASPRTVMPNEYLPAIFGPEDSAFVDMEDANATISLLMRYWNSIIADLERDSIHQPFVFEEPDGDLPGRDWAQGFLAGTRLARDGWKELFDSEREGDLFMIPLMAGEADPAWPKEPVTPMLEEEVLKSMAVGFLHSYRHFAAARGRLARGTYDGPAPPGTPFSDVERRDFVTSGKEICQSGFDSELIGLPDSGNSLIVGNFGEQKCQLSANPVLSFFIVERPFRSRHGFLRRRLDHTARERPDRWV